MLEPWQIWAVALGGGLSTLAIRMLPMVALRNIGEGAVRDILDRTGFGVMGGLVAQTAISTGRTLFAHGGGASAQSLGMAWGIVAVAIAFALSVKFRWKLPAALVALAFFALGGVVFSA
ncbi:conserved membrane hypothetical protein [uncultured Alphaproteobacteria bacterium]|uniref:Uncharacterized protein n=1 Tax=uncultured Alphaproteobacteria bacterium TaxID=91750 RepID=A0A212KJ44_9PROT|nr:conserved membrane hypothetical protein [uncultured Alphaproteobacteria bacterium]